MRTLEQFTQEEKDRNLIEGWGKKMFEAQSFTRFEGDTKDRIPFGSGSLSVDSDDYADERKYCHDCGVMKGELHVYGCDSETCPMCSGQAFCCGC